MVNLRVAFLGGGNINGTLRDEVAQTRPYRIVGTFGQRDELPGSDEVDVIVEAATQEAVRDRVPALVDAGIDVILLSVGALAEEGFRARMLEAGAAASRLDAVLWATGELTAQSSQFADIAPVAVVLYNVESGGWMGANAPGVKLLEDFESKLVRETEF